MSRSYLLNVLLGIVMLITMLFCIGDLNTALSSPAPYQVLFNNTGKTGVALLLNIIVFLLIFSGNITALATCSRELWAFSRDKGFPFHKWISHVSTSISHLMVGRVYVNDNLFYQMNWKFSIPFNSVYLTSVLTGVLCLINLGSTLAFNIIVSLSLLGLLSTYMISIGCVMLRRLRGQELPPARWSLGRFGLPINMFAFFYSAFVLVFSCFPVAVPVTLSTANWAPVVWVGVIVISLVTYLLYGRNHYTAPVDFVEGRRKAGVGLQATT